MDIGKYYYYYKKEMMQEEKEKNELRERQKKYIEESKKKIDDLLLNFKFEEAFEQQITFLISIEPKYVPYVLEHYDSIIKKHNKLKKIFNVQDNYGTD